MTGVCLLHFFTHPSAKLTSASLTTTYQWLSPSVFSISPNISWRIIIFEVSSLPTYLIGSFLSTGSRARSRTLHHGLWSLGAPSDWGSWHPCRPWPWLVSRCVTPFSLGFSYPTVASTFGGPTICAPLKGVCPPRHHGAGLRLGWKTWRGP